MSLVSRSISSLYMDSQASQFLKRFLVLKALALVKFSLGPSAISVLAAVQM